MCFLTHFLCCIHLYSGCLIIAITGIVVSIVGIAFVSIKVYPVVCLVGFILALIFLIVYLVAKLLLLIGVIRGSMRMVLVSFIIGILSIIYLFGLCIWQIVAKDAALKITLVIYFIIMELYYAWVVVSYWNVVRNCCAE